MPLLVTIINRKGRCELPRPNGRPDQQTCASPQLRICVDTIPLVTYADARITGFDSMTGHRTFTELTEGFAPERRARVAAKAAELRETMTLEELRKARTLSQEEMAASLTVGQPAVARLEKRRDMHVTNLRRYIEALGGTLEITARFGVSTRPDGSVPPEPCVRASRNRERPAQVRQGFKAEKGEAEGRGPARDAAADRGREV
jgi:transcriptional regulator with XRE-family HTH domain